MFIVDNTNTPKSDLKKQLSPRDDLLTLYVYPAIFLF